MSNTKEELCCATAKHRDRLWAESVAFLVAVACETHPEIMQKALSKVFDLSGVEDTTRRMMLVVSGAQRMAQEARELARQIHLDLEAIERKMDDLREMSMRGT